MQMSHNRTSGSSKHTIAYDQTTVSGISTQSNAPRKYNATTESNARRKSGSFIPTAISNQTKLSNSTRESIATANAKETNNFNAIRKTGSSIPTTISNQTKVSNSTRESNTTANAKVTNNSNAIRKTGSLITAKITYRTTGSNATTKPTTTANVNSTAKRKSGSSIPTTISNQRKVSNATTKPTTTANVNSTAKRKSGSSIPSTISNQRKVSNATTKSNSRRKSITSSARTTSSHGTHITPMESKLILEFPDIKPEVVLNIVTYARQLPKYGSEWIDENIFVAQLARHFGLTNLVMIDRVFSTLEQVDYTDGFRSTSLEAYARMICIFISGNDSRRISFIFNVFDLTGEHRLNKHIVQTLLLWTDKFMSDEYLNGLYELLMVALDSDGDRTIDLEEFKHISEDLPEIIDCLGKCFPDKHLIDLFASKITNMSRLEVETFFINERVISLSGPKMRHETPPSEGALLLKKLF